MILRCGHDQQTHGRDIGMTLGRYSSALLDEWPVPCLIADYMSDRNQPDRNEKLIAYVEGLNICINCQRQYDPETDEKWGTLQLERSTALSQLAEIRQIAREQGVISLSEVMDILGEA